MRDKPRVMAHQRRCRRAKCAGVKSGQAIAGDALAQHVHPGRALHLQRRLERVDWTDEYAEERSSRRGSQGLDCRGHPHDSLEQREHASVGRRVAKARERGLQQRVPNAAVEAWYAALRVERLERLEGAQALRVLVIDHRAHPHKSNHLHNHRKRARKPTAKRALARLAHGGAEARGGCRHSSGIGWWCGHGRGRGRGLRRGRFSCHHGVAR
mmetsp:Transcript_34165/g.80062  ORF Transcript_34165/g.80062 Transcript_34165/m.80062 type:complete len:212 (-) Transcript_34165:28-663(-)